ncbi:Host cell surface-exposed lipoprotein [Corynebacterium kutscheri]|uniref:Host cell surface-exposed lipoprotein n=1 Tax=Corynebacterium kutscheri TaxID=35755 RepID=A0A0F6TCN4_9CORY|nr:Ltp family lipoprotein [Corynebacterium kutscheri]AKE40856.1 protein of unknown function (DUF1535) [Corynebacterium kutscheri]VEH06594.1 Host cell surface-exposed lipoprotein [Corynebacterium kutscheri]VEH09153.1 Host cell surface-exposed lipoprotein [Corynebacterium kutscheri]VEH82524.1 Host cell surface-exposed lipoprotein [Corynebacterium kutscheri]
MNKYVKIVGCIAAISITATACTGSNQSSSNTPANNAAANSSAAMSNTEIRMTDDVDIDDDANPGQKKALENTQRYLNGPVGFSYEGLRDQLQYEGFPEEDIRYALDEADIDWEDQAVKQARAYKDADAALSNDDIYDKLISEKFTPEDARFGVASLG